MHDTSTSTIGITALLGAAALLATAAGPAHARAYHEENINGLTARCSTISTASLPEQSLARYDVAADADQGLLSCVVQAQEPGRLPENVAADVEASYGPVGRAPEAIDIRQVREGDMVTYLGTYRIGSSETLEFDLRISVEGQAQRRIRFTDHSPGA